jgi:hypothetical protein
MDNDDPEARIAELERQVAEQKRIADLERQLAEARAAAGQYQHSAPTSQPFDVQGQNFDDGGARRYAESLIEGLRTGQPSASGGPSGADISQLRERLARAAAQAGMSQQQLDNALQHGGMSISTGHSAVYPDQRSQRGFGTRSVWQRPKRTWTVANRLGAVVGAIGGCIGGAAVLTAVLPSTALWTSSIVCGGPNQLMVHTSHYSYKPGQSGTTVDFQCLAGDGAHEANFATISALQTLVVGLALAGVLAIGFLIRRIRRSEPVRPASAVIAGAVGLSALAVVAAIFWQGFASSSSATQMPHGGTLSIRGNGDSQTIACNDGHLSIDGREMTVTVTGHCARLSVDGVIHHITVDSVDAIDVDGIHNVITYHSGSPKITRSGGQNTVQQG